MIQFLAMAAATGLKAYDAYSQGQMAADAGESNAARLMLLAQRQRKMTAINAKRQRDHTEAVRSSQVAGIAANGGRLDDPTSQAILQDTAEQGAMDEMLIKWEGLQRENEIIQGAIGQRGRGRAAASQGKFKAGASLLKGSAQLYDQWSALE